MMMVMTLEYAADSISQHLLWDKQAIHRWALARGASRYRFTHAYAITEIENEITPLRYYSAHLVVICKL